MARQELIGRFKTGPTPIVRHVSTSSAPGLPDDILREAGNRLAIMGLVAAALWFIGTTAGHLVEREMTGGAPGWMELGASDYVSLLAIGVSLFVFWYARRPGRSTAHLVHLGPLFLIFTAFTLALMTHLDELPAHWMFHPMITWTGVSILTFAAIVPSPPWTTALASFAAASMNPISLMLARFRGGSWERVTLSDVVVSYHCDYLLAGVAVVISLVITRLGQEVTKAREMGSYQIGELIGAGGMGEVYRATHRMLARTAAIKLIRPEVLGASDTHSAEMAVARFKREAQVAANLRSPHTIELYDFGVTEDRTFYFVMEFLEGSNLEALVARRGPLPANRTVHILRQVCESLEEAHAAGLVHRDIKPANIHVGKLGVRHDFVKVLDFGIVKSVRESDGTKTMETAAGFLPGTPAYMAPELAIGDSYDGRADIYAVGCVAFFLLTGKLVFEGSNSLDMMMKHQSAQPERPSRKSPELVPAALDALILACLEKNPANRPQSAVELSRGLAAIQLPTWTEENARSWWEEDERTTRSA
ncbi:MAG TPA: serine/threonine-protein kinase [Candidatus Eisenbacteria bacterium]